MPLSLDRCAVKTLASNVVYKLFFFCAQRKCLNSAQRKSHNGTQCCLRYIQCPKRAGTHFSHVAGTRGVTRPFLLRTPEYCDHLRHLYRNPWSPQSSSHLMWNSRRLRLIPSFTSAEDKQRTRCVFFHKCVYIMWCDTRRFPIHWEVFAPHHTTVFLKWRHTLENVIFRFKHTIVDVALN